VQKCMVFFSAGRSRYDFCRCIYIWRMLFLAHLF
jgi:hypothetical protein